MGFILKKIIAAFLMPLPIGILLLFTSLFFLVRGATKKGKFLLLAGIAWLTLFSYDPVANLLLYPIENRYVALHQAPPETRYIYVLGCGHTTHAALPVTSQLDKEAVVRLAEGIRLYRQLHGKAIIILSGYSGLTDPTPHALMQQKLALALGVDPRHILLEPACKDTQEEAVAARKATRGKPLILVTSAYHMPRAMQWFEAAGLHPIPAPTYHQAHIAHPNYLNFFSVDALKHSTTVFHELLGMVWQKLKRMMTS